MRPVPALPTNLAILTTLAVLAAVGGCTLPVAAPSGSRQGRDDRIGKTAVQSILGAAAYHKLDFHLRDPGDPARSTKLDLSTMPLLGIAGQYAIAGGRIDHSDVEIGMDGGLLFSWDRDDASLVTGAGVVTLDRRLFFIDGFVGPYVSTILRDRVRLYAAAGASLMYGEADYDDGMLDEQDAAFGVGVYGRLGVEYRLVDRSFLGLGARFVATELDFGAPAGDVDVEGWQGFLTYTIGF